MNDASAYKPNENLLNDIVDLIHAYQGPIPFDTYMHKALYDAYNGYYTSRFSNVGQYGDFITAPEMTPLFGQAFANVFSEVLALYDSPIILEFGAGSGKFACDVMNHLMDQNIYVANYQIIEPSVSLKFEQKQYIAQHCRCYDKFTWLDELPEHVDGVIFANEVLDAMPVKLFQKQKTRICEVGVNCNSKGSGLVWETLNQPHSDLIAQVEKIEQDVGSLPDNYCSEVNLWIEPWVKSIARCLNSGVLFICDYGYPVSTYYHPERSQGTLRCHKAHKADNDPLEDPGNKDITAHVDFTTVARSADQNGMVIDGFLPQGAFLSACNLESLINQRYYALSHQVDRMKLMNAVKQLIMPSEMGESFKVFAASQKFETELSCFEHDNMIDQL